MKSRKKCLREVYVWELPVRIYHWLNALCIVILCITGFIIADPPAIMTETEANLSYWFGMVRFIHFVAAFVFFFNFVFRLYWGFVGNRYARWNNFIPLKKSQWKEILEVIKVDILMIKNKPVDSIGHNALASVIYFGTFWAFLLQSITGFGLYAKMSESVFSATVRLDHSVDGWRLGCSRDSPFPDVVLHPFCHRAYLFGVLPRLY